MRNLSEQWKDLYCKHRTVWFVLFTAWMVIAGLLFGLVTKALGAPAPVTAPHQSALTSQSQTVDAQRMCTHNPDGSCAVTAKKAGRLFRHGHYTKASGLPWHKTTTRVAKVRSVFRHKFARYYMHASAAKKQAIRKRFGLRFASARSARLDTHACTFGWGMAGCAARNLLSSLNHVSCTSTNGWPSTRDDDCITVTGLLGLHHGHGLSKTQVQQSGSVGFCAGNALLAVRGAADKPEGPSPLFFAGWGVANCTWAAWIAMDH